MKIIVADSTDLVREGMTGMIRSVPAIWDGSAAIVEAEDLDSLRKALSPKDARIVVVEAAMVEDSLTADLVSYVNHSSGVHWILLAQKVSRLVLLFVKEHPNFSLITKSSSREEICSCLRMAAKNEQLICNECLRQLIRLDAESRNASILTPAECMVLALLAQGLKVKDIAELQCRSKHTIRTHKRDIFSKLGVNTTVEAIMTAYKLGIINPPEQP